MFLIIIFSIIAISYAQDVVQVDCDLDAITIHLDKGIMDATGFEFSDVHLYDHDCIFEEDELVEGYGSVRIEPFTACGTKFVVNGTHVFYQNVLSTMNKYGVVVGSQERPHHLRALVTCTYNIDLKVSTEFIPNITMIYVPLPAAHGEGNFRATMNLYTDRRYLKPYITPPTLPADGKLYVGINLLGEDISSDVFLLIEECWATPFPEPDSFPQYPLITDGCAIPTSAEGNIRVRNNGVGHQAFWQSSVFKFLGDFFDVVWLHCDLQLCIEFSCEPECVGRKKRSVAELTPGKTERNIVSASYKVKKKRRYY